MLLQVVRVRHSRPSACVSMSATGRIFVKRGMRSLMSVRKIEI